ncbi:helix-turn-helix domain-containing protein [Pseudonocardia xishanensis]|uniref:Helix-turn-helix domain-containing protein n=1 Tax=Pseudonocardia xishanensis TaxID=630995 RepID=A0ABP8S097_9PSEU
MSAAPDDWPVVLVLPRPLAGTLVLAIGAYVQRLRSNGHPQPAALAELGRALRAGATQGQPVPSVDGHPAPLDDPLVTPLLLDYAEAARRLSCSQRQVKRLTSTGELPTVQVRGLVRIRTADLDTYVDQLATTTRGAA